jgi:hypothetical protein
MGCTKIFSPLELLRIYVYSDDGGGTSDFGALDDAITDPTAAKDSDAIAMLDFG